MLPEEGPVAMYRRRLARRSRSAEPFEWACDQVNLGNAWLDHGGADPAGNVERAIAAYRAALEVFTHEENPYEWAVTHMDLAAAYNQRFQRNRAERLEQAIGCGEAALEVFTRSPTWRIPTASEPWATAP
jgi:tetratricopeptide (TPR) repeat protein